MKDTSIVDDILTIKNLSDEILSKTTKPKSKVGFCDNPLCKAEIVAGTGRTRLVAPWEYIFCDEECAIQGLAMKLEQSLMTNP